MHEGAQQHVLCLYTDGTLMLPKDPDQSHFSWQEALNLLLAVSNYHINWESKQCHAISYN